MAGITVDSLSALSDRCLGDSSPIRWNQGMEPLIYDFPATEDNHDNL